MGAIIVSYYTDPAQKVAAQHLAASAVQAGVPCDIQGVPGVEGLKTRAEFIRLMLNKWEGHSGVLYVEATGLLRRPPTKLLDGLCCDVAAYVQMVGGPTPARQGWVGQAGRFGGVGLIYPATLYFAQSPAARRVLDRWIEANRAYPARPEATNLLYFLASEPAKFTYLPAECCWVERAMRPYLPEVLPVIEHIAPWVGGAPEALPAEEARPPITLRCYTGLGDTFYMRPAVRRLAAQNGGPVYIATPWPQLFWDLPGVQCLRPGPITYRAPAANVARMPPTVWAGTYEGGPSKYLEYTPEDLRAGSTPVGAFMARAGVAGPAGADDFKFKVPQAWVEDWMLDLPRPLALVGPPTVRAEWINTARNPVPAYLQGCVDIAPWAHWEALGWVDGKEEQLAGPPLTGVWANYMQGQLGLEQLVALVGLADFVVCGPCHLLPMAAAVGVPVFCIFGGSIPPAALIDPAMGAQAKHVAPAPFCACYGQGHNCNKEIPPAALAGAFGEFLAGLTL